MGVIGHATVGLGEILVLDFVETPSNGRFIGAAAIDWARHVRPGDLVVCGQADAAPHSLLRALMAQRHALQRTRLFLGINEGLEDILKPEYADAIDFLAYCGTGSNRALSEAGVLDVIAQDYSTLPHLLNGGTLAADVVLLRVAPADAHGRHSLGMAREYLVPALQSARTVLAEVDPAVPWTFGGPYLSASDIDVLVASDAPWQGRDAAPPGPEAEMIGHHVAALVEDGATLQTGIGAIPDAVLAALENHRDLGMHSGSLGEGLLGLVESGALTNRLKGVDVGLTIAGILLGGPRLRRFAHKNPSLELRSTTYTHDHQVLAGLNRFTAVNSAIEVDVTGQVNSEVARGRYLGALGGVQDFVRGALASRGGVPIVALPAMAGAHSRIVVALSGPVTVPRNCAGVFVTEYGAADLRGLTLSQRIDKMIGIAHPAQRDLLAEQVARQPPLGWKARTRAG
ncbi:acetyl-CoA hydrolase/transferase family protein [Castellaniella sp.]|uniref:acetyl-CoA hydrolase/transferase family protein n=1 Tax=Castellaniella sp. TaxID=1955812 RepID=UPI003565981D